MFRSILSVTLLCIICITLQGQSSSRKFCGFRCYPAHRDSAGLVYLHNQKSRIGRKIGVAIGYSLAYEAAIYGLLYTLPEKVSKWDSDTKLGFGSNYRNIFTKPLALDGDEWYVNYVGHPYQGAFYYNTMRAQGATMWQSSLFAFAKTITWEFFLEGAIEQPSVQDLVVTPIAGTLLGELFHFATMRMSRNGFKWYEKAFVCVFNPAFAIHNGFKWAGRKHYNP